MSDPNKSNKSKYITGIILVVVLAVTNPSEESHKQVITDQLANAAAKEGFVSVLGLAAGNNFILVQFQYHNYLIFSTTTCDGKRVSIGVLGNVFVGN